MAAGAAAGWLVAALVLATGAAFGAGAVVGGGARSSVAAPAADVRPPGPAPALVPVVGALTAPAAVPSEGGTAVRTAGRQAGPAAGRVPPAPGEPVRRFEAPPHEYGPGHRGVDLPARPGAPVVSPADGVVTFSGPVAGRRVVVVEHAGATLTSLEPVVGEVAVGTTVRAGEVVATVQDAPVHAGCATARTPRCLHWGVRVDGRYVDPWWWLGRGGPVRLLPLGRP